MSPETKLSVRLCSVTDALAIVGDRHTLPIVRELAYGFRRFKELAGYTGAPRDVLTSRLRRLEAAGVVERRQYSDRPPRHEYRLTRAGRDLLPVVLALKEWGDTYCNPGAPSVVFRHTCGEEFHPLTVCRACREPHHPRDLTIAGGTHPPTLPPREEHDEPDEPDEPDELDEM